MGPGSAFGRFSLCPSGKSLRRALVKLDKKGNNSGPVLVHTQPKTEAQASESHKEFQEHWAGAQNLLPFFIFS